MGKWARIVALVLPLALGSVNAGAMVLDFENLGIRDGDPLPNGYGQVANWSSGFWLYWNTPFPPYIPKSGTGFIYSVGTGRIVFGQDVHFAGAWFFGDRGHGGYIPIFFELYRNNALVALSDRLDLGDAPRFLASGYNGDIDEVRVIGDYQFFGMDDFEYVPVPEPASIVPLSLALAAMVRRKRHNGGVGSNFSKRSPVFPSGIRVLGTRGAFPGGVILWFLVKPLAVFERPVVLVDAPSGPEDLAREDDGGLCRRPSFVPVRLVVGLPMCVP
ncbi:MAG: PEP-CTERM sorting domain-containing protein [Chthonomonadaceae bacterium]|nr:PEP-CTERM sorting domain-containing protein [Chthonomonadaceae bacterium]